MIDVKITRRRKLTVILADISIILLSYIIAFLIKFGRDIPSRNWDSFINLSPWIVGISVFFVSIYNLYILNRKSKWDIIRDILLCNTMIIFITMSFSFILREFALPRIVLLLQFFIASTLLILWKLLYVKFNIINVKEKFLVIGNELEVNELTHKLNNSLMSISDVEYLSSDTDIETILNKMEGINNIAIGAKVTNDKKSSIIYNAVKHNKTVFVVPSLYELLVSKSEMTSFDDTMVFSVEPFGLSLEDKIIKRAFDILFSIFVLIVASPLFLIICLLIKFDSKGKIIYKQKRIGRFNKEFNIYKFRTMVEEAEKNGPNLAIENDPRITKVGKFLRRTRMDELPQFFNVLKGDMSIVGPRPEREYFIRQYEKSVSSFQYRTTVKPGITGYAQIMGKYTTNVENKIRFDLYYIRNYSFWIDIIIIFRTLVVIFMKNKSEGIKTDDAKQ